ncbi:exopolyphosphatase [Sodiomyces alkalinus F11]|uniref:Exopolyphosphatase n=1 Tax=Sodiomyces alkalinus (strain CBS 110278 / VKM F-3762 / F11) TaxID=1314773 RepID=A0A3N2Q626_SODAK|nr:exopolyphosphatase [Sodiomyces alkalinus F11]ROT42234.1 exopolyphosphatase [Sodiomyces alkalinus F11]
MSLRPSLNAFLAKARDALASPAAQRPNPLTLVVGNESADLDSLCSAVVYAYLRSTTLPSPTLHIPLSNLHRADLALRPEFTSALARAHLQPSELLTLDNLPSVLDPRATRWVLVDHNALTGALAKRGFSDHVVGCIDHHADEGRVPPTDGTDEPRVIEKCGSCASLIAGFCRPAWEEALRSRGGQIEEPDAHIARLALAPILVDTAGLKAGDRTTDADVQAVEFLEGLLQDDPSYARDTYVDELMRTKEDLSGLGFRDIFRKDYKQWEERGAVLGISSVVKGLDYLLGDKAGGDAEVFLEAFRKWAEEEKKLDVAVIMTTARPGGEFQRELLVWAFNEAAVAVAEGFVDTFGAELGLETWREGGLDLVEGGVWRKAWKQRNVKHSRKKVGPMLREAMNGNSRL